MERINRGHSCEILNISFSNEEYLQATSCPDTCERAAEMMFDSIIDKLALGIMFDMHRLASAGDRDTVIKYIDSVTMSNIESKTFKLNIERNIFDLFGNEFSNKKILVECPICHKPGYDATKLSGHLETHMNLKRSSSREARKRIAASQVKYKDDEENDKTVARKMDRKKKMISKARKQASNSMY